MKEEKQERKHAGWLLFATFIFIIVSYALFNLAMPFLSFVFIFPLLYHLRKFAGYIVVFFWYVFLWIIYFISEIFMWPMGTITSILLMVPIYLTGYLIIDLHIYVSKTYPPGFLNTERAYSFSIGSFLTFLAFILSLIVLPLSLGAGRDILAYIVLVTLLTTALLYWLLNYLKISLTSDIARDIYLCMLVLGLLIIEPAYMMGFCDSFYCYIHLPLLLYSYILISIGGAFTMLALQNEPRKVDIQQNI